jgi:hypothetical protein
MKKYCCTGICILSSPLISILLSDACVFVYVVCVWVVSDIYLVQQERKKSFIRDLEIQIWLSRVSCT